MSKNKALDKIAKLLVLAQDPRTPKHESESAMNMATKLMAVHKIAIADVEGKKKPEDLMTNMNKSEVEVMYENQDWEAILGSQVAKIFECQVIILYGSGLDTSSSIVFLGSEDDLQMAIYFFEELQITVGQEMRVAYPKNMARKRDSFAIGMVSRLISRMQELYEKVKRAVTVECRDLIIVKTGAVNKYFKQEYPMTIPLRRKTAPSKIDGSAYRKGFNKGGDVDLASHRESITG